MSGGGGFERRDALHQWSMRFGPNMTPMVDVVMVILIFFMASAAFLGEEWFLESSVPVEAGVGQAGQSTTFELPPTIIDIVLDVTSDGTTLAKSDALLIGPGPVERIIQRFESFPRGGDELENIDVIIKPTPVVPYREIIRVHEAVIASGIKSVGIGVGPNS